MKVVDQPSGVASEWFAKTYGCDVGKTASRCVPKGPTLAPSLISKLLSYFFGAVILAVTINLVVALSNSVS